MIKLPKKNIGASFGASICAERAPSSVELWLDFLPVMILHPFLATEACLKFELSEVLSPKFFSVRNFYWTKLFSFFFILDISDIEKMKLNKL